MLILRGNCECDFLWDSFIQWRHVIWAGPMLARLIKKFFRKSRLSNCEQLFLVFFPQLFPSNWQQLFLVLRRLCQQPVCHSRFQLALFLQQNFASSPRYSIFMQSHVRTTVRKRNSSLIKSIPLRVLRAWSWSSFCFKTFQLFNWYMIQRVIEQIVQQKFYFKDAMICYRLKKLKIFFFKDLVLWECEWQPDPWLKTSDYANVGGLELGQLMIFVAVHPHANTDKYKYKYKTNRNTTPFKNRYPR